jgi:hypothetical protein
MERRDAAAMPVAPDRGATREDQSEQQDEKHDEDSSDHLAANRAEGVPRPKVSYNAYNTRASTRIGEWSDIRRRGVTSAVEWSDIRRQAC